MPTPLDGANPTRPEGGAPPRVELRRFADPAALEQALTDRLARAIESSGGDGAPAVMLSGGHTPLPAYRALGQRRPRPGPGLVVFYSDDRYVPSSSDASNYHQSRPLVDALGLADEQLLRVRTELPLDQAAADYDRKLTGLAARRQRFGLGLLGLGEDGHTASLFNPQDIARARGQRAISVHRPDGRDAVSVTPEVLGWMAELVFVVAGADKRAALAALLAASPTLAAWQAVRERRSFEVWTEPAACPTA
ncbi:MAG TPA: 6-phosphogluconolactonase [Steroidobacteraceae bacterium]|nr:6-phosphogluconolactonase [Steroidobacteraceae bacterium]